MSSDLLTSVTTITFRFSNILNIMHLQRWLMSNPTPANSPAIWARDFNKHNPLCSGPDQVCRCRYSNTELFMQLLTEQLMVPQLPPGTHTHQAISHHTWTTIDMVFCDFNLTYRLQTCSAAHSNCIPMANHLPIHTILDLIVNRQCTNPTSVL